MRQKNKVLEEQKDILTYNKFKVGCFIWIEVEKAREIIARLTYYLHQ